MHTHIHEHTSDDGDANTVLCPVFPPSAAPQYEIYPSPAMTHPAAANSTAASRLLRVAVTEGKLAEIAGLVDTDQHCLCKPVP